MSYEAKKKYWTSEKGKANKAAYYLANKEKLKANMKRLAEENKEARNEYRRKWQKERVQKCSDFHISVNLRSRLNKAIKGEFKPASAIRDLGCSADELRRYLESQFTAEMSWDNYGTVWTIDHILPLANYHLSDRGTLRRLCHYTNLQPLSKQANLLKSNKEMP